MQLVSFALIPAFPLTALSLHFLLARLITPSASSPQKTAVWAALLAAASSLLLMFFLEGGIGPWLPFSALCLGAAAHVYFHAFNMSETARRVRLLMEIGGLDGQRREPELPSWNEMVATRLKRLEQWGEVEKEGTNYLLRPGWLSRISWCLVTYERLLFPQRFRRRESLPGKAAAERERDHRPSLRHR